MKHQPLHHNQSPLHLHCDAVSSSSAAASASACVPSAPDHLSSASDSAAKLPSTSSASVVDDAALPSRDAASQEVVAVDRRGDHSAVCRWIVQNFPRVKARVLWSKYVEVGGFDCRLLIYPKGDSQALPGYVSVYLQIMDPRGASATKWECFASYRLSIVNVLDDSKTIHRDSWHRFSVKKRSHGWCDFAPASTVLDPKQGYLFNNDSLLITADILMLNESISFSRDCNSTNNTNGSSCSYSNGSDSQSGTTGSSSSGVVVPITDVSSGKFTWKVHNFSLFKEMIKTQKIMSPVFPAGECNLRISVYQSSVSGADHLSMCLESKDTEKAMLSDRSCWCLFRMSVLNQKPGSNHMHRDSYGRFAADNKSGDNTSLGWNDYMKMTEFLKPESGFLVDDKAVFSTSFHVIKEFSSFSKNGSMIAGVRNGARKSDGHMGKFTWKIENFTRLKDILKKRKITGLCIKSRRFQIGNRDCRLIVYPRGQSQPPCHLSVFLEVTDSRNNSSDWSCFVSHRLSVVNQRLEDKSVTKESQNRYSKAAKDWGWREFVTLTNLFDQDSGFIVQDTVIFTAEVLILKETSISQDFTDRECESTSSGSQIDKTEKRSSFTWKVENFLSFKEIMETRKIFSKFFQAGGCELRIGVYESFDTICIYLESDQSAVSDPDKNFWVRYRMAIVNQKNPANTIWKESSICTKTWNNSVLQFMKVSDMMEADAGFLVRDTVIFVCEILDCCPWFEFSDLEVLAFDEDQHTLTTDPDELIDSEDSEGLSGDEEDIFRNLLSRAGFHLTYGENSSQPQVTLREKLLMDAGAIAGFLTGLRVYLDDPAKVKRLLLPANFSEGTDGKKVTRTDESSPSLMNLLMSVKVLQQAIIDLLLDIMVECCQPSECCDGESSGIQSKISNDGDEAASRPELDRDDRAVESTQVLDSGRVGSDFDKSSCASGVQSSDFDRVDAPEEALRGDPVGQAESPPRCYENPSIHSKTKWPEQSEELLGLIVNSLRALDGAVPQGCPEPRRRPQSAKKIALVLDKAPKHLQHDLVALVPKLVEHAEHPLAAHVLLERIQKPDAEPSLRTPIFGALSQLECGSEVWEHILHQSMDLLKDSNDEPLAATIDFIFKAASQCTQLPEAVRSVRARLKDLGAEVSTAVLNFLSKTVNSWGDVAETILRDIGSDEDISNTWSTLPYGLFLFGNNNNGTAGDQLRMGNDMAFCNSRHVSDIYVLIEMLSIPCLAAEALQTFERAVSRGLSAQSVAMVLERRLNHRINLNAEVIGENAQIMEADAESGDQFRAQRDDFTTVLGLAETLALSRDPRVIGFVKDLYIILFKWFPDESYRGRILKRLVDHATTSDSCHEAEVDMEILAILVTEEQEYIRPVLGMMREVAELANADRAALWHQLCTSEEEIIRLHDERKAEISTLVNEKASLSQKLSEVETTNSRLKSEMKAEAERFTRDKRQLSEQVREVEGQLEWLRSERDEEIIKLTSEKKVLQDRMHDAEAQLSQLKSRKRDELKKVTKEKNALAERLKSTEAARKKFDEELKRYATEKVTREEIRQSLEDEVRRLTQTVGQTEGEKREKEEQVARCEAYIDGMESKLQACQHYIQSLEGSLQEEMSRHAPLYGVGLEILSLKELETISRIHEEGLRQIHALQQRKGSPVGNPLVTQSHNIPHNQGIFPAAPGTPPMAVGLPPMLPNGLGVHGNGHANGAISPWFNHTT